MTRQHLSDLIRRASSNHGIIDTVAIDALGISARRRQLLVANGMLDRVAPGIFVLAGTPFDWERRLRVALRQVAPAGAAAFSSAARLWDLPGFRGHRIEVVTPRRAPRPSCPVGVVHRSEHLGPADIVVRQGFAVTAPFRTLTDLAAGMTAEHLDACIQDLARRKILTLEGLRGRLERWRGRGRSGVRALELAIQRHGSSAVGESFLETAFLALIGRHGLPAPEVQVEFTVDDATYRVDALYRAHDLVVELKGHGTHATRSELNHDSAREAALLTEGFRVVSFTYDQVMGSPGLVVHRLARLLGLDRSVDRAG